MGEVSVVGAVAGLAAPNRSSTPSSATAAEIAAHGHVLTPGRYVGAADAEEDDEDGKLASGQELAIRYTEAAIEATEEEVSTDDLDS